MNTEKENFRYSEKYSKTANDNLTSQQKLSNQINTKTNDFYPLVKGIKVCYYCKSNEIIYDIRSDEIYCYSCGTVLRQGFIDYENLLKELQETEILNHRKQYDKSYWNDLLDLI